MTVPVTGVAYPRRTVRVAIALATGQAALCAVIGWMTFGPDQPHRDSTVTTIAAPPPVMPAPTFRLPPAPPSPSKTADVDNAAVQDTQPVADFSTTTRPPKSPSAKPSPPSKQPPPPLNAPSDTVLPKPPPNQPQDIAGPTPTPSQESEFAEVGAACDTEGETETTGDGLAVMCVGADDGTLWWQLVGPITP